MIKTMSIKSLSGNKKGISLLAAIFIMLAFSLTGLVAISLVGTQGGISVYSLMSSQALYLAESGIQYVREELSNDDDWSNNSDILNKALGLGSFDIEYTQRAQDSATITFTGEIGDVTRKISEEFTRSTLPLDYAIYAKDNLHHEEDLDITGDIRENVPRSEFPVISLSPDLLDSPKIEIDGDYTFSAGGTYSGNYYIDGNLTVDESFSGNVVVTGSINMVNSNDITIDANMFAAGNILMNSGERINITGVVFAGTDFGGNYNFNNSDDVSITGTVIVGGNANFNNPENFSITYDAAIAASLPQSILDALTVIWSDNWYEIA